MPTGIEWTQETWNPVTGCTPVSEGCEHCYAKRMANRLRGRFGYPADEPFRVTLHPDKLGDPLHWKKPRQIFVCSMGDLFHEDVPFEYIDQVLARAVLCPQHTFQVLTKRPERLLEYLDSERYTARKVFDVAEECAGEPIPGSFDCDHLWPLPNVWLGVTAENQRTADERIPLLLQCPAAVRFVSLEPLLGCIDDMEDYLTPLCGWPEDRAALDWVIVGAETGPGARPMDPLWARNIRDQGVRARVPFFFKRDSSGSRLLDGREWNQMPEGGKDKVDG